MKLIPSAIVAVDDYPATPDDLPKYTAYLLDLVVKTTGPNATAFLSDDVNRPLSAIEIPNVTAATTRGVVLVFPDIPEDMLFLIAASLRADLMVRMVDAPRQLAAVWSRRAGITAFQLWKGGWTEEPVKRVKQLLPATLRRTGERVVGELH